MSVIVDTPIWSELFRRNSPGGPAVDHLQELILDGEAILLNPIRLEVLSGIRDPNQFEKLRRALRAFPSPILNEEDHERAAEFLNICRSAGIQGSNRDFLICSASIKLSAEILTLDRDFDHFAKVLPIRLAKI